MWVRGWACCKRGRGPKFGAYWQIFSRDTSRLERRIDAYLLQRIELGQQLGVLRVVGQALSRDGHGESVIALAAQDAHPLAPIHSLSRVALQGDQLLQCGADRGPVLSHLGHQSADEQDVLALRKALRHLIRQQISYFRRFWLINWRDICLGCLVTKRILDESRNFGRWAWHPNI